MNEQTMPPPEQGIDWPTIGVVTSIIVAIIGGVIWVLNKIFKFGAVSEKIKTLEKTIDNDIKPALTKINDRVDEILKIQASAAVTESKSPRQLNDAGKKILKESGIKEIVDENYQKILDIVKKENPENAYRAEQCVLMAVVQVTRSDKALKKKVEEASFSNGSFPYIILLVGATYIRDKIFADIGMKVEDIDNHTPKTKAKKK